MTTVRHLAALLGAATAFALNAPAAEAPAAPAPAPAIAASEQWPVGISNVNLGVSPDNVWLTLTMHVDSPWADRDREVRFTPVMRSLAGSDSLVMPTVVVAGHNRYYRHRRRGDLPEGAILVKAGATATAAYEQRVAHEPWMDASTLLFREAVKGCCAKPVATAERAVAAIDLAAPAFRPAFVYVPPTAEPVKTRELQGEAYVDFVVDRTEINPDYRRNPEELRKIVASIDTVRRDPDCTITALSFKGYASPEGTYDHNTYLARERTNSLAQYVGTLYHYPDSIVSRDYEPEDWEGLRRFVAASDIDNRDALLAVIDDPDLDPDIKNLRLQARYPDQYLFLLKNVYPGLRHSDYRISYTVRSFYDPQEILRVMRTQPQKLSLNELFLAANSLQAGSADYDEVFETAVRMYPDDPVANLNAANAAMGRGDLDRAGRYLDRAGTGAEAYYARGVRAAMLGDYAAARAAFATARADGCAQAAQAASQLDAIETHSPIKYLTN